MAVGCPGAAATRQGDCARSGRRGRRQRGSGARLPGHVGAVSGAVRGAIVSGKPERQGPPRPRLLGGFCRSQDHGPGALLRDGPGERVGRALPHPPVENCRETACDPRMWGSRRHCWLVGSSPRPSLARHTCHGGLRAPLHPRLLLYASRQLLHSPCRHPVPHRTVIPLSLPSLCHPVPHRTVTPPPPCLLERSQRRRPTQSPRPSPPFSPCTPSSPIPPFPSAPGSSCWWASRATGGAARSGRARQSESCTC